MKEHNETFNNFYNLSIYVVLRIPDEYNVTENQNKHCYGILSINFAESRI